MHQGLLCTGDASTPERAGQGKLNIVQPATRSSQPQSLAAVCSASAAGAGAASPYPRASTRLAKAATCASGSPPAAATAGAPPAWSHWWRERMGAVCACEWLAVRFQCHGTAVRLAVSCAASRQPQPPLTCTACVTAAPMCASRLPCSPRHCESCASMSARRAPAMAASALPAAAAAAAHRPVQPGFDRRAHCQAAVRVRSPARVLRPRQGSGALLFRRCTTRRCFRRPRLLQPTLAAFGPQDRVRG